MIERLGLTVALLLVGCARVAPHEPNFPAPCTPEWLQAVEQRLGSGDGQGHGPDPGSEEWRSVIEFRLGIRGHPDLPPRQSEAWCEAIDRQLFHQAPTDDSSAAPPP